MTRLLTLLSAPFVFVILFEQFALVINLFADRLADSTLFGIEIAALQLLALNALLVFVRLPPLSFFWSRQRRTGREPPLHGKFAIGFLCMWSGFAMVASAVHIHPAGAMIPVGWLVATYMLITIREIVIAPLAIQQCAVQCRVTCKASAEYSGPDRIKRSGPPAAGRKHW